MNQLLLLDSLHETKYVSHYLISRPPPAPSSESPCRGPSAFVVVQQNKGATRRTPYGPGASGSGGGGIDPSRHRLPRVTAGKPLAATDAIDRTDREAKFGPVASAFAAGVAAESDIIGRRGGATGAPRVERVPSEGRDAVGSRAAAGDISGRVLNANNSGGGRGGRSSGGGGVPVRPDPMISSTQAPPGSAPDAAPDETRHAARVFREGELACERKYYHQFPLNHRLSPTKVLSSLANTTLDKFAVHGRSNLYVYSDEEHHVFYVALSEVRIPWCSQRCQGYDVE